MSSAQGRFTTVDPSMLSVVKADPQSWNRYSYALNNPLRYIDPDGECWVAAPSGANTYDWMARPNAGQTCVDAAATDTGHGVTVYGSSGASDITKYQSNTSGYVNAADISTHHDAQFTSRQGTGQEEDFLKPNLAAALFNVAFEYHAEYPGDAKLAFTGGTTATGASALFAAGPMAGTPIHSGHNSSIDLAYMDANGRTLSGNMAASGADSARMRLLIKLFDESGLHFPITGSTKGFGFGPTSIGVSPMYDPGHLNHMHVQPVPRGWKETPGLR